MMAFVMGSESLEKEGQGDLDESNYPSGEEPV